MGLWYNPPEVNRVRVIAGSAGGIPLVAVPGRGTRPTLDRVRESVFAILTPRLQGARVLDLYAGTGALGLEALSRGAASCLFVESEEAALVALRSNIERTHLAERAGMMRGRLPQALRRLTGEAPWDLVLCDPPYSASPWTDVLPALEPLLAEDFVVAWEHGRRDAPTLAGPYRVLRVAEYGQTSVSFLGRGEG